MNIAKLGFVSNFETRKDYKNNSVKNKLPYSNSKQISEISNVCYKPINFGKSLNEHKSWGVHPGDKNKPSTAKLYTFDDAQDVNLLVSPSDDIGTYSYPLKNEGNGVFSAVLSPEAIKHGDRYAFKIKKSDNTTDVVKDPYSYKQPEILGYSEAYDHDTYKWADSDWFSSDNLSRFSRNYAKNNHLGTNDAIIYELNLATKFPPEMPKDEVKKELERIKDLGYNAIHIMPVENTYSFNWGYDGVDKLAASNFLGGPDGVKSIIDLMHQTGLNVVMDMVPNHLGPDGAALHRTGDYLGKSTDWGDGFNYDSEYVRDWMVNAALNWVNNYHCDGLRFDMTKAMGDDTMMQQIAAELNYHNPDVILIAEDGRGGIDVWGDEYRENQWQPHDMRVINLLKPDETAVGKSEEEHIKAIENIRKKLVPQARIGFDSEWDFYFYHILKNVAYQNHDLDAYERACVDSGRRLKYDTSHDEIGNYDGTRPVAKFMVPFLKLDENMILDSEDCERADKFLELSLKDGKYCTRDYAYSTVSAQKCQLASMTLALMLQTGELEKYKNDIDAFNKEVLDTLGIKRESGITPQAIEDAFENSLRTYRMCAPVKYFSPGPIMNFQGEENIDLTNFRFFREFDSVKDEDYLYVQKGYPYGRAAYEASIPGRLSYSLRGAQRMQEFENLTRDLNRFMAENPAATKGKIIANDTIKHYLNPTIAMHSISDDGKSETYMINNFANESYPNYDIEFPQGVWSEIINTNDSKYGGDGDYQNEQDISSVDNMQKARIAIPRKSTLIFKKIK